MKKMLFIILAICLIGALFTGCSKNFLGIIPQPAQLTPAEMCAQFKAAGLPVENIIVYTEETDENNLLGRPNQYIGKVNFADIRLEQLDSTDPNGGSIEIFTKSRDLIIRQTHLEAVYTVSPRLTKYMFVNGNYLLRLSKDLTPAQANEYKEIFMKFK